MIRRARSDGERLGEMRKGRRESIEKGSREGVEKETKDRREAGPERPPLLEFLDPTLRCSLFLQASKFVFTSL